MTIENVCGDVTFDRCVLVNTTTEEVVDVGIVYLPLHITTNLFLTSTS